MKKQAKSRTNKKKPRNDVSWSERKSVRIIGGLVLVAIAFALAVWLLPVASRLGQTPSSPTTSAATSTTQTTTTN
jgi:hypothetical protein